MSTRLVFWRMDKLQPLNSGYWHYTLTVLDTHWFRKDTPRNIAFGIEFNDNIKAYTDLWDNLIKSGKEIKA
jgi:hypothetical protein